MSTFLSPIKLIPNPDGSTWTMCASVQIVEADGEKIEIPEGFVTDLASVPEPFWNVFPPFGKYTSAAILHDWMYKVSYRNRKYADDVFLQNMIKVNTGWWASHTIWCAVRLFAQKAWDQYVISKT